MTSFITSYSGLFGPESESRPHISSIEIPLIQRDYAQGREDDRTTRIRVGFLGALRASVVDEAPLSLDFVYGDAVGGVFRPLDGQQRLTTLFLLHWYLGARCEATLSKPRPEWTQFSYATRESARIFCERIVTYPPPAGHDDPSSWIVDQPWYRFGWRHDPTISSMLVMIEDIHRMFGEVDPAEAWRRLTDADSPAITFHVMVIDEIGDGDELYVKMNSRGKPLTEFETFKAQLEKALVGSDRSDEFARKVDRTWADLMWRLDDGDDRIDSEFLNFFSYIIQICEWRLGTSAPGTLTERAIALFSPRNDEAADSLALLIDAFDVWDGVDVDSEMAGLFDVSGADAPGLRLFAASDYNLMRLCCRNFDSTFGNTEAFLLFAVILHRSRVLRDGVGLDDFGGRLRVLRNLLAQSDNEIRPESMSQLLNETESFITTGDLDVLNTFNTVQIEEERAKREFLGVHAELIEVVRALEDQDVLRGALMAFDLDAETLASRTEVFDALMSEQELWPELTGALLALGDYSRPSRPNYPDKRRFGSTSLDRPWRLLLTGGSRRDLTGTREVLASLCDDLAPLEGSMAERLHSIRTEWVNNQSSYDWRYYLVKYEAMRAEGQGLYVCAGAKMGFTMRMLKRTVITSYHREPFIFAAWGESGVGDAAKDPVFFGYESDGCWLRLVRSQMEVRNTPEGWEVRLPEDPHSSWTDVLDTHSVGADGQLVVEQVVDDDGDARDLVDRIQLGASLISDLVAAGA